MSITIDQNKNEVTVYNCPKDLLGLIMRYYNFKEEDIIETYKISDVMDEDFLVIKTNNNLQQIIDIMKQSGEAYKFPVNNMDGKFVGIISLGEIRDTFYEEQMDELILAEDIVRNVEAVVYAGDELKNAINIFKLKKIDYIPLPFR